MPARDDWKKQLIKGQIGAWTNRAAMAKQQGSSELEQQALEKKREYENALARLEEFELED